MWTLLALPLIEVLSALATILIARALGAEKRRSLLLLALPVPALLCMAWALAFQARPTSDFPRPEWLIYAVGLIALSILPTAATVVALGRRFRILATLAGLLQIPFTLVIGFFAAIMVSGVAP
ncbi:MAG: hypothetical protein QM608_15140 [Caulobacter sp.]